MYTFKEYEQPQVIKGHLHLGGENPSGERIDVTSLYFTRGGKPWIGIMGEIHFSRSNRQDWRKELCKMKAGGVTIVSTYLFWIYHEEEEGKIDFTGDNDIRAFLLECREIGLDAVIRIGPWAHGECRNGGFPDWLLKKPFPLRDNNEEYLKLVRIWYGSIYEQVRDLFYKDGGNIIAIQLENEYVDNAAHLMELKKIALECGLIAPIYTVTGWNSVAGARIPVEEVVPVFGGYCDAPWEPGIEPLPPSTHYFFHRQRNDVAIGADLLARQEEDGWQLPYEMYPFATCELGGGLQATHLRRYIVRGMDVYAISLVKLGVGNNLPGYYMYHGGTHKVGKYSTMQESKETGYPNDYPIRSYDFQAPVSEFGEIREHYRLLNLLHLFLQDFGHVLAPMAAVDARESVKREDISSLRYGMRTDGKSGFVFINHYQRRTKLEDIRDVVIDTGTVRFPAFDVRGEICFFLPFHMDLSGIDLVYATAQPVCRQGDTFFFVEIPGIQAVYQFSEGTKETGAGEGTDTVSVIRFRHIQIVTLTWEQAGFLRRLVGGRAVQGKIYIGQGCDLYEMDGCIRSAEDGKFTYQCWNEVGFESHILDQSYTEPVISFEETQAPMVSPMYTAGLHMAGERKVTWKKLKVQGNQGFVEIAYEGDVAQIYADGELVADDFYCGLKWRVPASLLSGRECYLAVSEMRDDFYREFADNSIV